ncbi:efflux RND transporter periplasmic adaptor subunit [Wenyingzhuangia sp. IMCC45467]
MKKTKIIIIAIVTIGLGYTAYSFFNKSESGNIVVTTSKITKENIATMVTATGTVEPITQVEVGTQVSGVVEKIYVDYNSHVKEGQLIAELDKTNLLSALTQAQATYDNALNEKNYLKQIYNRQKDLFENKVISQADYDEALYNFNNSKSTVVQRLADLEKAKTNVGYANIYAPINGVVLSKDIDEGQTVAASYSTPTLFTIAQDLKEMQVEADVDEADIGQITEGQRVSFTVDAYPNDEFNGTVTQVRLSPTVTSNVVTYTVVIKAQNPNLKLKPGLTATISIYTLELKNITTIEAKAINFSPNQELLTTYYKQHNLKEWTPENTNKESTKTSRPKKNIQGDKATLVWQYNKDGSITPKHITLGTSDGIHVQVLKGAKAGDVFVSSLKAPSVTETANQEEASSPFMPKRPGGKKK